MKNLLAFVVNNIRVFTNFFEFTFVLYPKRMRKKIANAILYKK